MRNTIIVAAAAGLVGMFATSGANALTNTSPAGIRTATEAMDTSALVHCRPYRHWHEWEHRRTTGCGGGSSVEIRHGHRGGVAVEERERSRTSVHSRTTTRGETNVRGSTSSKTTTGTKSSTATKSGGTSGTSTKSSGGGTGGGTKSSGGTSDTGRGQGTGKSSSGGGSSSGSTSGGSSGTQNKSQ